MNNNNCVFCFICFSLRLYACIVIIIFVYTFVIINKLLLKSVFTTSAFCCDPSKTELPEYYFCSYSGLRTSVLLAPKVNYLQLD